MVSLGGHKRAVVFQGVGVETVEPKQPSPEISNNEKSLHSLITPHLLILDQHGLNIINS